MNHGFKEKTIDTCTVNICTEGKNLSIAKSRTNLNYLSGLNLFTHKTRTKHKASLIDIVPNES